MAKTKALISFAATAKLICALFSHMQKAGFPHDVAHLISSNAKILAQLYKYYIRERVIV